MLDQVKNGWENTSWADWSFTHGGVDYVFQNPESRQRASNWQVFAKRDGKALARGCSIFSGNSWKACLDHVVSGNAVFIPIFEQATRRAAA